MTEAVRAAMADVFRPEFLNRTLDEPGDGKISKMKLMMFVIATELPAFTTSGSLHMCNWCYTGYT